MLEYFTVEKLLEYDQADRKNAVTIQREQEKLLIYQAIERKAIKGKWYAIPLRLFRKAHRRQRYRA
ncbi:hypothetical protein ACTHPF_03115 [Paenibacillus sp. SAF-054]|uniref:hypothetical protein n=1 Tax=unclassified Paenibacillus TaxID=185978 RepID=UPI003F7F2D81